MKVRLFLAALALTLPTALLAAPAADDCPTKPADRVYWSKIYADAVAHGNSALKSENQDEASAANQLAGFAGDRACMKEPSKQHVALTQGLLKVEVDQSMDMAAKAVAEGNYNDAVSILNDVEAMVAEYKLPVPAALPALKERAGKAMVDAYFNRLDKALKDGKVNQEAYSQNEKNACGRITEMKLPSPERCKKYTAPATR